MTIGAAAPLLPRRSRSFSSLPDNDNSTAPSNCNKATTKAEEISLVLAEAEVDLWKLRELALTEGGLVNDKIRKMAWPKLVGLSGENANANLLQQLQSLTPSKNRGANLPPRSPSLNANVNVVDPNLVESKRYDKKVMARCLDAEQIERDIARCTWHLLTGSQRSRRRQMQNKHRKKFAALLKKKQRRLGNLINLVLIQSYDSVVEEGDKLRYYQGYHDVACIFLGALGGSGSLPATMLGGMYGGADDDDMNDLNHRQQAAGEDPSSSAHVATKTASAMGLDLPMRVLMQISFSHFRDAMRTNFQLLTAALRLVILPLIGAFDSEMHAHLTECEMQPFFAISWIITWFSHDVRDTALVKRLFDAFIVGHPLLPVYVSLAMVLHPINRAEILGTECDFASVHNALANLPKNSCTVGWKYTDGVDGGYVSGYDEDDDTMSFDGSFVSDDLYLEGRDDEDSIAPSVASSSLMSMCQARVPFEELIDMAISLMRRIPPRKLIPLARRYFFDVNAKNILADSSSIALLQSPPSWGLTNTSPSDWVLKQRARCSRGLPSNSRRVRRARSRSRSRDNIDSNDNDTKKKNGKKSDLDDKERPVYAVIAAGIGPDGDGDEARKRRRRRRFFRGVMAVSAGAVAWGFMQILGPRTLLSRGSRIYLSNMYERSERQGVVDTDERRSGQVIDTNLPRVNKEIKSASSSDGKVLDLTRGAVINGIICPAAVDFDTKEHMSEKTKKGKHRGRMGPIRMFQAIAKSAQAGLKQDAEVVSL